MKSLFCLVTLFSLLLVGAPAFAHEVGLSRGAYSLSGRELQAELSFARGELASWLREIDADRDGTLAQPELDAAHAALTRAVVQELAVLADGAACSGALSDARLVEQDGVTLRARYRCAEPTRKISVDARFLDALGFGHRHLAHANGSDAVLSRASRTFAFAAQPEPAAADHDASFLGMLWFGVEHILFGFDHLVFLFALLIVGGTFRSLVKIVTAFTIAHSVTLGLAAFELVRISPSIVEPAIALSIAYVGIENYWLKHPEKRWRIAFPFGLVHGFGFAGVLGEVGLARDQIPLALFSFNLGVELGQLAILAVALPLVVWAHKSAVFRARGVQLASAAVVVAGFVWFVERVPLGL